MDGEAFVGRTDQLDLLRVFLSGARDGRPSVVLVDGPPGIGKTALVHHALGREPDVHVIDAAGDEAETDIAWGVVDQLARALGPDALAELLAMVPLGDTAAVGGWLLGRLAQDEAAGPLALVVDDLPWADPLSISALTFALRRLRSDPVVAIFTARSSDLHLLPQGLHQLVRGPHGHQIRLSGLGVDEVAQLSTSLGVALPPLAMRRVAEQTEGNPLLLGALLREVPIESLTAADERPLPAPVSLRAAALGTLAGCDPATEQLVVSVATLGPRATLADAAAVAGLDDPLPAVDEAVARGLLRCDERSSMSLSFQHPMVRAAIYHDLGPRRRAELHRAAAALTTDPWTRLRHLVQASTGPDPELVEELVAFADQRRGPGAGGTAEAGAALRLAARVAPLRAEREDLLLRALECFLAVGDATGAGEIAEIAATFDDSPRLRFTRGALLAINGSSPTYTDSAIRLLHAAWDGTDDDDDPSLRAGIATQLATTLVNELRLDEADEWAARAIGIGGTPLLSDPAVASALARAAGGRHDAALALLPEIPEGGLDPFAFQRALGGGVAALWNDDPATARALLLEAHDAARAFGVFFVATLALVYLSDAEHRLGLLDDAVHHAQLAASTAADSDQAWFLSLSHSNAAIALSLRGEVATATEHAALARAHASNPAFVLWSQHATARAAHLAGDLETSRAAVARLEADPAFDRGVVTVQPWHVVAVEVHLTAGELDTADQLLERIGDEVRRFFRPILSVTWQRLQALRAAAEGAEAAAIDSLERGLELLPDCPSAIETALVELEVGALLRRIGQRRRAAGHLRQAVVALGATGARPHLERAERELAACGLSPAGRSAPTADLTPQERTVAMLACRGQRTKEIASELVVSPKTVEYHLGNVYRKLGVSNRAQLVTAFGDG